MVFCRQDRPCHQDRPVTIEVESRGISCQNRPVTIEVGFLSESASFDDKDDKVSESNNKVEFLQIIK